MQLWKMRLKQVSCVSILWSVCACVKTRSRRERLTLCSSLGVCTASLLHVHALTDCEVIFNQSDSMCLGLNGLLQVNLSLY